MKANTKQNTLEIPPDLGHLPETVGDLVPLYRASIVRFDAAVHARDLAAAAAEVEASHEIVERAHSLARFQNPCMRNPHGFRYCFYDVARIFDRLTRATPGTVPLFGQAGRFVASLSTVRIQFDMEGLGASIGMSAYHGCAWSFEIRAVERERSFFTGTGYRSFMLCSLLAGEPADGVDRWCVGHVRHWWNGEGGKASKYALVRIGESARPVRPASPTAEDDDSLECSTCGVDIGQLDEYGECSETGDAFCPACYSKHQEGCVECLPDDEDDDDGRGDIGNGYRSEPVSKPSTQLSLF